jgi:cell wall-active antibiotic response 4TMS protein YvqF
MARTLDVTSLVAGLAMIGLGGILLLDRVDVLDLRFGYFWPALLGALGAILVASGLGKREGR